MLTFGPSDRLSSEIVERRFVPTAPDQKDMLVRFPPFPS